VASEDAQGKFRLLYPDICWEGLRKMEQNHSLDKWLIDRDMNPQFAK
jgi:hypothetical protein